MQYDYMTLEDLEHMRESGPVVGIFKVSDQDYHKFSAIGSTALREASISMADYFSYMNPDENMPSGRPDHFAFGSALHAYLLDKEEFAKSFVKKPDLDFRTKEGKAWKDENSHRHILSDLDMYLIEKMEKSVTGSEYWKKFTSSLVATEVALFWQDGLTGIPCKAKVDLLSEEFGILDIKTTSKKVTDRNILYSIKDYRYELQAAHYVAGLRANAPFCNDSFTLGWVEKSPPFSTRASVFTESTQMGYEKIYRDLMIDIAYSIQNRDYPGPGGCSTLEVDLYDY